MRISTVKRSHTDDTQLNIYLDYLLRFTFSLVFIIPMSKKKLFQFMVLKYNSFVVDFHSLKFKLLVLSLSSLGDLEIE